MRDRSGSRAAVDQVLSCAGRYQTPADSPSDRGRLPGLYPELPGCAADGPTYRAALAAVGVVISEWIETARELGRPIPEPKGRLLFA